MRATSIFTVLTAFATSLAITAGSAQAVVVEVGFQNDPDCCDNLLVPKVVDELGRGVVNGPPQAGYPFPADETIRVSSTFTDEIACEEKDNPDMINALVSITNITFPQQTFDQVWYVGNPNTYLSNVDGYVNQLGYEDLGAGLAFRIDTEGKNRPLVSESMNPDGIFEPGETWTFIIQDFSTGLGGPTADKIDSIGVAGGSLLSPGGVASDYMSSGSIIAFPIPEPGVAMLFGSALVAFAAKGRRMRR